MNGSSESENSKFCLSKITIHYSYIKALQTDSSKSLYPANPYLSHTLPTPPKKKIIEIIKKPVINNIRDNQ